ncbi:hypothetical protein LXM94_15040 [Rhizobium sp. TRM95111]|uniref:hypothetical protein n=1 Tax=Rhizobium alarense TaxID=2846851 RepID=UPI001F1C76E9|nr:hypothetical protein [Rhizobium alarense]MCF3641288.1 hypothetical protein [Rhizobium alarense]
MNVTKAIPTGLLAGLFAVVAVGEAAAWTRSRSVTGWHGTASVNAHGNCAGGTCSRSVSRTGPYGYSASRSGSVSCDGPSQTCSGSRTTTGAHGGTVHREGSVSW